MEQIIITIESVKAIRGDLNRKIAMYLKQRGIKVIDADVLVLCNEPGRCWTKKPGQTSCTAHG